MKKTNYKKEMEHKRAKLNSIIKECISRNENFTQNAQVVKLNNEISDLIALIQFSENNEEAIQPIIAIRSLSK